MFGSRRWHRVLLSLCVSSVVFYVACGGGEGPSLPPCVSVSDCPPDNRCINNVCVPPGVDAGPAGMDAGPGGTDAGGGMDASSPTDADVPVDAFIPTDAPMSGTE
jgi:hypothetical protein